MVRLACVDIPFFSLQVLFRREPDWKKGPAAVVDRDEPTGRILSINEAARRRGVRPGLSYGQALSLAGELRAAAVAQGTLDAARREVMELLSGFTPEVEPVRVDHQEADDIGTFWLNASGLDMLYPQLSIWMQEARTALERRGFLSVIAVGFTRFGSYIVARSRRKPIVLSSAQAEEQLARRAPLRGLPLSPRSLELLQRLGVQTVGDFLDLPAEGVARRFGREARATFQWAHRERIPMQPITLDRNASLIRRLDDPVGNLLLLTAYVDELLDELFQIVTRKQRLVASIRLELYGDKELRSREQIRPAAPTDKAGVLKSLCRLRLSARQYDGGIDRIVMSAEEILPIHRNGELFDSVRRQATEAGRRAFALIRARFGNDSIRRPILLDEHLPEKRYAWEEVAEPLFPSVVKRAEATADGEPPARSQKPFSEAGPKNAALARTSRVVRRLYECDAPPELDGKTARLIAGPFVYTGKWWQPEERREYFFARSRRGLLWIYREAGREVFRVQGVVD